MRASSFVFSFVLAAHVTLLGSAQEISNVLVAGSSEGLKYTASLQGDRIPDFSYCGYEASSQPLPHVAARVLIQPSGGDDTLQIQSAIDQLALSQLSVDIRSDQSQVAGDYRNPWKSWRGAVILAPGQFQISKPIYVWGSGLVLRGSGNPNQPTEIIATGYSRRPAIVIGIDDSWKENNCSLQQSSSATEPSQLKSSKVTVYVPIGSHTLKVSQAAQWQVGASVQVIHPSTADWIERLGMSSFPSDDGRGSWLDWKPGSRDQVWYRTISAVDEDSVTLDAPITSCLDPDLSQATLIQDSRCHALGQSMIDTQTNNLPRDNEGLFREAPSCHHLGVENLTLISQAHVNENALDEEHAWDAIRFSNSQDCWTSHITCQQFAGSAVSVGHDCRRITVANCVSSNPVSEDAGWRRLSFLNFGQQVLFLRCQAEDGRHDFSVGPVTAGPNAFVDCSTLRSKQFSGPTGSWATGVLYDNVQIDGAALMLTNRETKDAGAGWCAANCVLWNCIAPEVVCRCPPTGFNLASGICGQVAGNGTWKSLDQFTSPESLFKAQLEERIGKAQASIVLQERVFAADETSLTPTDSTKDDMTALTTRRSTTQAKGESSGRLQLNNGWLTFDDQLAIGKRQTMTWWRGSVLPSSAMQFDTGLTRFVPGLDDAYYTDPVEHVARDMQQRGAVALEHHWGLWYDRRRDDHLTGRRATSEVMPPFYELPWARSGKGIAWDGLSRYDLHRFNHWYFDRLQQFALEACEHDLILIQYMYFQHNVLESGAHWADFPWRPVNCLQDTGFAEPPITQSRKRIFLANEFYDVSHPVRRELHTKYIRHCLDTLRPYPNVIFALGEEFTGPPTFIEFWLDTLRAWMSEKRSDLFVMLSACRDAQDAILQQPDYNQLVDMIDIKYWWYTSEGNLYAPLSGQNLAPRQQLREWKEFKPSRSVDSLCRSVREIRLKYPEKAVLCSVPNDNPWAILAAGASLPALPESCELEFLRHIVEMQPVASSAANMLSDSAGLKVAVPTSASLSSEKLLREMSVPSHAGDIRLLDARTGIANKISEEELTSTQPDHSTLILWSPPSNETK